MLMGEIALPSEHTILLYLAGIREYHQKHWGTHHVSENTLSKLIVHCVF